jgi:hypothetical protein
MHSLGAIVLAAIAGFILDFLFGLGFSYLAPVMAGSVGVFLPLLIKIALTGAAYFGGMYFALTLVPLSNSKTVMGVMLAYAALTTVYSIIKVAGSGAPMFVHVVQTGLFIAIAFGLWVARSMVEGERAVYARHE